MSAEASDVRGPTPYAGRAAELRRDFDRAFAAAPSGDAEEHEDLLAVRVGGEPYALSVREIAGVETCRGIVPLPGRSPGLLGLAGTRGGVLAVYDLAALLGHPGPREAVRWLIVCGGADLVGLGLAQLEGWLRVPRSELSALAGEEAPAGHVRGVVRAGRGVHAVISIASVLETLKTRAGNPPPAKER